ncbi:86bff6ba-6af6-4210-9954-de9ddfe8e77e [Sclerotinia trifoliorum]|uniref:86bff6ba-6af6-4210-9954-de9ddfe8e77e n=1 Tax=Sclerotinia trifoliorum TaxID=28548 RepID=A0A8H2ZM52_9HELO|nr:86bff6ba-6af6-4210-9954-de9ddfe8e77e [Sclerotinia trifoliorum]
MEELSDASTHNVHTQSTNTSDVQVTDLSAGQGPDNKSQISVEIDQSVGRSEAEAGALNEVSNAVGGLTATTDRIPDPYILSQISLQNLGKSPSTPSCSNSIPQRHLLAAGTKSKEEFNTFTMFPHLPLEIQRLIWKKSLPGPKILLIKPLIPDQLVHNSYHTNYSMPSSIVVNKEAFEVFSKESVLLRSSFICQETPNRCFQSKIVLDFKIDSIYIDFTDQPRSYLFHRTPVPNHIINQVWSGGCAAAISHLIIPLPARISIGLNDRSFLKYVKGIIWFHRNIRHLTFILADETRNLPCAKRDIVLVDPISIDYALNLFECDPRDVPCEDILKHASATPAIQKFDFNVLKKISFPRSAPHVLRFVLPEDLVVDFKIVVLRAKTEELARRKKRFYALKELIAQNKDLH